MQSKLDDYFCIPVKFLSSSKAEVAHLVERDLAKVEVAGSSPVFRSKKIPLLKGGFFFELPIALVVELVDTQDLKSCSPQRECGSDSRLRHK